MARYRVVQTPVMGTPAFLQSRRSNSAEIYSPFDGAVLEAPDAFTPYQTISRTAADTMARLASRELAPARVIEWEA